MSMAFAIQSAVSLVAITLLVILAAWARIPRPCPPLDEARARGLLADEFPGEPVDGIWIAADRQGAVARSGETALFLSRAGDGYVARSAPWAVAEAARAGEGRVSIRLKDAAAPRLSFALDAGGVWPPRLGAGA